MAAPARGWRRSAGPPRTIKSSSGSHWLKLIEAELAAGLQTISSSESSETWTTSYDAADKAGELSSSTEDERSEATDMMAGSK